MTRIELLAICVANMNEFLNPESKAFRCSNPGLLKARSLESLGTATDDGIRRFETLQGGLKALVNVLEKTSERHPRRTIRQVLAEFDHGSEFEVHEVLTFICMATGIEFEPETTLRIFTER